MGMSEVNDASFYEYVASVIEEQKADDEERRGRRREQYTPVQLIAPLGATGLPEIDQFRSINCRDLSPTGFSFVTDDPPTVDKLVVALGVQPNIVYLVAEVVHRTPVGAARQYEYLVGCQFTKRLRA
jgi:hypothetical protein